MARTLRETVGNLITRTRDAYSFDTYGELEWRRAIRLLLDRGYNERGVEAILRSKIARWAADARPANAKPRGEDIINYLDDPRNKVTAATITRLAQETFNDDGTDIGRPTFQQKRLTEGADLAGDCEGEDIAELIDLAIRVASGKIDTVTVSDAAKLIARIGARKGN